MINRMVQTGLFILVATAIGIVLYWQVEIIGRGGPVMVPIVMCSVFSLAIIFERFYYFISLHLGTDIERFFEQLRTAIGAHRWKEAQELCESWKGPVARVTLAGVAARDANPAEIDEAMEQAAHEEMPRVELHLRWLSTLAQVSPVSFPTGPDLAFGHWPV